MTHNLPLQLTSFIGREQEQAQVRALLGACRLLTLTGSGGVGKTRLALRVAADLVEDYADGVWLVELASLADGSLVPQTVASALAIPDRPGSPLDATLSDALRSKHILLILDDCEHLLTAVGALIDTLLRASSRSRILATSREALNLAGEIAWRVPSLTLPESKAASVSQVLESEAAQLFLERARAVAPGFALSDRSAPAVADLCRRLDGMPLAVEQIAARLGGRFRLLTTATRFAPTRQQTLEATIDWSYALLSPEERNLFDRLSVFAGGFALEAAEMVGSGLSIESSEVLDLLGRLVDKSLVLTEPNGDGAVRYRLLETLRRYGQERLRERGESKAVAGRHASFLIEFAEQAEREFFGPSESEALKRLELEYDDVRSALRFLIAEGDAELGQRLASAFGMFWFQRSHLTEGRSWVERLLTLPGGEELTLAKGKCLSIAAALALGQGDYASMQS